MKLLIDKSFYKDTARIDNQTILRRLADLLILIKSSDSISKIPNCKKIKGSSNSYRIRLGDWRIGFEYQDNVVTLIRFIHRKDIYRKFP